MNCEKCRKSFYNFKGKKCILECPLGFYNENVTNECKMCSPECDECKNLEECTSCKEKYFLDKSKCNKKCKSGYYADTLLNKCLICNVAFCKKCSKRNVCDKCVNGYSLNNIKQCIDYKSFVNPIKSPYLFSEYTYKNFNSMKEFNFLKDLNGIGIGSSLFTLNFWLRLTTKNFFDFIIFEIKCSNQGNLIINKSPVETLMKTAKIEFKIAYQSSSYKCLFEINSPIQKDKILIVGPDCNLKNLFNWTFFSFSIEKEFDLQGKAILKVFKNLDNKLIFNEKIQSNNNFKIISKLSHIYFNSKYEVSPIFELSNLNIMEYLLDDKELNKRFLDKPILCDYQCFDCSTKCKKCSNGNPVSDDGYCPPSFISINKDLIYIKENLDFNLREFNIDRRLSSERYSILFFFYLNNQIDTFANKDIMIIQLYYKFNQFNEEILSISTEKSKFIVKIAKKKIKFSPEIIILKRKIWYCVNISVKDNSVTIQLIEWSNPNYIINSSFFSVQTIRLTEDAHLRIGEIMSNYESFEGSLFDIRLYLNNAIKDKDYNSYKNMLKCKNNCHSCNHDLTCIQCYEGFYMQLGICLDPNPGEAKILLNEKSLYNKESHIIKIPEDISNLDEFTITLFFRKKIHSLYTTKINIPSLYDVLTIKGDDLNVMTILKEHLMENLRSDFIIFPELIDDKNARIVHYDSLGNMFNWFNLALIITKTNILRVELFYNTNNRAIFSSTLPFKIKEIRLGDKKGEEMNIQLSLLTAYYKAMNNEVLMSKIRDNFPKNCNPSCISCEYGQGICSVCANNEPTIDGECDTYYNGIKLSYIYPYNNYENYVNKQIPQQFSSRLSETFRKDVNSLDYQIIGWFYLFTNKFNYNEGNRYIDLLTLDNVKRDSKFNNIYSLSYGLIGFKIRLNDDDSMDYVFTVPQQMSNIIIKVDDLKVEPNIWLLINSGISVSGKKFKYIIFSIKEDKIYRKEILLNDYVEPIQETSILSLFGINKSIDLQSKIILPNGIFYHIYLVTNKGISDSFFFNYKEKFPVNHDICDVNCSKCALGICFKCNNNMTLDNNECLKTTKMNYYMLSDQSNTTIENFSSRKLIVNLPSELISLSHSFQFFIRRNFIPRIYGLNSSIESRLFIEYGPLYFYLISSQNEAYIRIDNSNDNFSSVLLGPIDTNFNYDFEWWVIILNINLEAKTMKAQIQNNSKNIISQKQTNYIYSTYDYLKINNLNDELSIYSSFIIVGRPNLNTHIFDFPINDCGLDCSLCQLSKCILCETNYESNDSLECNKIMIEPLDIKISHTSNSLKYFKLFENIGKSKYPRFSNFSLIFNININHSYKYKNIFRITSNDDLNLLKYDSNSINYNILGLIFDDSNEKFTLYYHNRYSAYNLISPVFVPLKLIPSIVRHSDIFTIGLSVNNDLKQINVVIYNKSNIFIQQSINFQGYFENLNINTNIIFGEDFITLNSYNNSAFLKIFNIAFSYEKAFSPSLLFKKVIDSNLHFVEETWDNTTVNHCVDSPNKIIDYQRERLCLQENRISQLSYIQYERKSVQSLEIGDLDTVEMGIYTQILKSFTLNFLYRRISFPKKRVSAIFAIAAMNPDSGKYQNFYELYEINNSIYGITRTYDGNEIITIVDNIYKESSRFEWLYISVRHDLVNNNCSITILNFLNNKILSKISTNKLTSPSKEFSIPYGWKICLHNDLSKSLINTNSDIHSRGLSNQIPSKLTGFELSFIIFVPNKLFIDQELIDNKPQIPVRCNNCLCKCELNECPLNCNFKRNPIELSNYFSFNNDLHLFQNLNQFIIKNYSLNENQAINTLDNFTISFKIERVKEMIHSITNQDSSFNSDTLFILSNKNNHRTFSLKYKSAIPNEVADYSIITLKVVDNNIRVFIGCNPYIKYISYKDILPENNLKSINKLILVIKLDLKQKYSKFVIFADDLRIDNEFKYLFSSEPINRRTLFYNNPLIENVFMFIGKNSLDHSLSNLRHDINSIYNFNFCNKNCSRCFKNKNMCLLCANKYKMHNNHCVVDTIYYDELNKNKLIKQ